MSQQEKAPEQGSGLASASMYLGIISFIINILPLANSWFVALSVLSWLLIGISILLGVIALIKGQKTKAFIGIALSFLAALMPVVFAQYYLHSALESMSDFMEALQ